MPLRDQHIDEIQAIIADNTYWGDGSQVLKRLGVPQDARASGNVYSRTRGYLAQADDQAADRILRYFEVGPHQASHKPWPRRGMKLFISHRDDQRAQLAKLAAALEKYGIACFLAHDAIETGKLWREELQLGLSSMDALLAYCSSGFAASVWTGQEVGYAFGKNVPVIPIIAGEGLQGLLEQRQALKRIVQTDDDARQLASEMFVLLQPDTRIKGPLSEGLARELKFAGSFGRATFIAEELVEIGLLTEQARADIQQALEVNGQTEDLKLNDEFLKLVYG